MLKEGILISLGFNFIEYVIEVHESTIHKLSLKCICVSNRDMLLPGMGQAFRQWPHKNEAGRISSPCSRLFFFSCPPMDDKYTPS